MKIKLILLIILISLIPLSPLFHPGLPITHDGQDHVARIANFYLSLSEGNLIPRWAENLNWGYGHPILMFLYPLPSYTASFFHFLGFSFVDAAKMVFGFTLMASGVFMYMWLVEFLDDFSAAAGAILYMFAPYRFIDLYVIGAIGESFAFVFPPLLLFFLLKMSKNPKKPYFYMICAAFSLAALTLAHNAISLMFLPFILAYIAYLFWSDKNIKLFICSVASFVLGFLLSAFFWVPAFIEGKYTLRDIVTGDSALKLFVSFKDLIYGPWSYRGTGQFSVQVGILQWIAVLSFFLLPFLFKKQVKVTVLAIIIFIYFVGSIFIMLPESTFVWKIFTTLEKFQFPWRFLSISVFSAAILGAITIFSIGKKFHKWIFIIVVVLELFLNRTYWLPRAYQIKAESFYSGVYDSTTDTGESAPIWSVRFMEHRPKALTEVINGQASIMKLSRSSTHHVYQITASKKTRIRENTLYFPGWKVYVDGKEDADIQFQEPANRGLITYYVPTGKHIVDISFGETNLRKVADLISALTIAGSLLFSIWYRVKYAKRT